MQGKRAAYSLMEVLAVIAIVVFLLTVGLVNYLKVRDRQQLENAARELIVYLNSIAQKARLGNRGGSGSGCGQLDKTQIAEGRCKLSHWQIEISDNVAKLEPQVYFYNNKDRVNTTKEEVNQTHHFTLPQHMSLSIGEGKKWLVFDSLYGLIYTKENETETVVEKEKTNISRSTAHFILTDGDLYYVFLLENGTFTHGCFCQNSVDCKAQTC